MFCAYPAPLGGKWSNFRKSPRPARLALAIQPSHSLYGAAIRSGFLRTKSRFMSESMHKPIEATTSIRRDHVRIAGDRGAGGESSSVFPESSGNVAGLYFPQTQRQFNQSACEVGGFSGQTSASRSRSIRPRLNDSPRFIPRHVFAARCQAFGLARFPSQNGHVRHCSGRTS